MSDSQNSNDRPAREDADANPQAAAQDPAAEETDGSPDDAEAARPADEVAELLAELEAERRRVLDLEDQLLRRAAEFQNYRRRTQEDLAHAADRGRGEVILRMIEVLDDLRRSREAAEEAAGSQKTSQLYDALKEGVDLVYRKLETALAAFGVEPIEAVGQPFDEELHEALMQQEANGDRPGTVIGEIQKGYRLGDRVLRHARVVVAQ